MVTEAEAKKMVARMAGLKRWKKKKAGWGHLVLEDEDNEYFFQAPSNISAYDPDVNRLVKVPVEGTINKKSGKIELNIPVWRKPMRDQAHGVDIPKRYRRYPLLFYDDIEVKRGNTLKEARKILRW